MKAARKIEDGCFTILFRWQMKPFPSIHGTDTLPKVVIEDVGGLDKFISQVTGIDQNSIYGGNLQFNSENAELVFKRIPSCKPEEP
jgi:hypothetical protein